MKKPPIIATFLMLLGVAILCSLGTWQLNRLEWKEKLVAKLEAEYAKDASVEILGPDDIKGNFDFKRGTLRGTYDYDKQVRVGPRVYEHIPGDHIITPFRLRDGSTILVNRGWVSDAWRDDKQGQENATVTGLIRLPAANNSLTPKNVPEKKQWYSIIPTEIGTHYGLENVSPYVLYIENTDPRAPYPIAAATKPDLPNNHFQYALFWFAMAGTLVTIYALRFLRK